MTLRRVSEEREWVARSDREISFQIAHSSRLHGWRGFEAFIYETSEGYSDVFFVNHSISMHVGRPVLVTSRCDSAELHRLQIPGDLKVIPAGHSRVWEIAAPTRKLVVNLRPSFVVETADAMGIDAARANIAPQLHLEDRRMEHIGWALLNELESQDSNGRLYAESLGIALAAQLLRRCGCTVPRRMSGLPKRSLKRVLDHIQEHLAADLSLAELSGIAGVSPSHFKVRFKESTGTAVHRYVIAARAAHAVTLLTKTTLSLSDVAACVGFSDQSHLSYHIRRLNGTTPATLRREAR